MNIENINATTAKKNKRFLKEDRKLVKYLKLHRKLFEQLKAVRAEGRTANFN